MPKLSQPSCTKPIKAKSTTKTIGLSDVMHVEKAVSMGLTSNSIQLKDLPDFVKEFGQWNNIFIPTLLHALFRSCQPFAHFASMSCKFYNTIKTIVTEVYPDSSYQVKSNENPIQLMVCFLEVPSLSIYTHSCWFQAIKCLTACWSAIGTEAIKNIQEVVASFSTVQEAHNWLLWAKQRTGPLFFEQPTPAHCVVTPGAPGFIVSNVIYHLFLASDTILLIVRCLRED